MNIVAEFEKVTIEEYRKVCKKLGVDEKTADSRYGELSFPTRATIGSAGYDFFTPEELTIKPGEIMLIPTGFKARIAEGWVLELYTRSSLGFKYMLQLCNNVGIIDADYYNNPDNEGHILCKLVNNSKDKTAVIPKGKAFMQGIFIPFGITESDISQGSRNGGFGSTN